jgi:hypothetical protein
MSFFMIAVLAPASVIWYFINGIPGLLLAAPIVLLILPDPIRKVID